MKEGISRGFCQSTHGAFSVHVRHKYSDLRTSEGKELQGIINGIIEDLGGNESLSSSQRLILDGMKSKLIVILQIGKYADNQIDLIDKEGNVLPCLKQTLTHYQSELRRDLELLHGLDRRNKKQAGYSAAMKALGVSND